MGIPSITKLSDALLRGPITQSAFLIILAIIGSGSLAAQGDDSDDPPIVTREEYEERLENVFKDVEQSKLAYEASNSTPPLKRNEIKPAMAYANDLGRAARIARAGLEDWGLAAQLFELRWRVFHKIYTESPSLKMNGNFAMNFSIDAAEALLRAGRFDGAEDILNQLTALMRARGSEAGALAAQGRLWHRMGELEKAIEHFLAVKKIQLTLGDGSQPYRNLPFINNLLSFVYEDQGLVQKAIDTHLETLVIAETMTNPVQQQIRSTKRRLPALYIENNEPKKALTTAHESYKAHHVDWEKEPVRFHSMNVKNLTYSATQLGRALELNQIEAEHPERKAAIRDLQKVSIDLRSGKIAPTITPSFREQLHSNVLDALEALGGGEVATTIATVELQERSIELTELLQLSSDRERLRFMRRYRPFYQPYKRNDHATLARQIVRLKGIVLESMMDDRRITRRFPAGSALIQRQKELKSALLHTYLQPATPERQSRMRALSSQLRYLKRQQLRGLEQARQNRPFAQIQVEAVCQKLPQDFALVEYLAIAEPSNPERGQYVAVILTQTQQPIFLNLGTFQEIHENITLHRKALSAVAANGGTSPEIEKAVMGAARNLFDLLLKPIAERVPPATYPNLVICPDNQLNFVSFACLLDEKNQFAAQSWQMRYVASSRDIMRSVAPSKSQNVAVFYNPEFEAIRQPLSKNYGTIAMRSAGKLDIEAMATNSRVGARDVFKSLELEKLDGTQEEARLMSQIFVRAGWKSTMFGQTGASEQQLRKENAPAVLHLATHGFFLGSTTRLEHIAADQNGSLAESNAPFIANPMYRSGIALAGGQSTLRLWRNGTPPSPDDDGLVLASEIAELDLFGTQLVVLSACDTGVGEVSAGEGVFGVRRAFVMAGAGNLLLTLWPISDSYTPKIMADFYQSLTTQFNPAESLAENQRKWLIKLRNEHESIAVASFLVGPFILSSQGTYATK